MNAFDQIQQLIDQHADAVVVTLADGQSVIAPAKVGRHIQFVMEVAVLTKNPLSVSDPFFTRSDNAVLMAQIPQAIIANVALCAVNLAGLEPSASTGAVAAILSAAAAQDEYLVDPDQVVPVMDEMAYAQVMDELITMFNAAL